MSGTKVKGIIVEIGGDTTSLSKAINSVSADARSTQSELKKIEKLLKMDPTNVVLLKQKQELLNQSIEKTEGVIKSLRAAKDKADSDMANGTQVNEKAYRELERQIEANEIALQSARDEIDKITKSIKDIDTQKIRQMAEDFDTAGEKIKSVGEKISDAGEKSLKVTGTVMAAGAAVVNAADDLDSAADHYLSATGTVAEGMETLADGTQTTVSNTEKFKDVISSIYSAGFGESFEDIANSMASVKTNIDNIDDSAIKRVTESALTLRDVFGFEVNESTRTAKMLMDQFGLSADEAYNLIAQGAQNGLDKNGDLLDTINEYSVHFKQLGIDAETMFAMLISGSDSGTFSVDKLGDAVKEFGIRVREGGEETIAAFEYLGYDAQKVLEEFREGGLGAAEAMQWYAEELADMPESAEKAAAGVALFGTTWEDLGAEGIKALSALNSEISFTNDAMDVLKEQKCDNLKSQLSELGRSITTDVAVPIGEMLLPMISEVIDWVAEWVSKFGELSPEGQELIVTIAAIAASIGPLLIVIGKVISAFGSITSAIGSVMEILPKMKDVFSTVLNFIVANPVAAIVAAIVALVVLIGTKGDEIQAMLQKVDDFLQGVFAKDWTEVFGPVLGGVLNAFFDDLKVLWDSVKQIFDGIINFIRGVFTGDWTRAWEGVKQIFGGIFSGLSGLMKSPINAVIRLVNGAISGINSLIRGVNNIPGVNIGQIGTIPMLANGGTVWSGSAIVGEAGPELLTVSGGRAIVQPLTNNTTNHATHLGGVNFTIYGAPGQDVRELAEIVMDEMQHIYNQKEAAVT